MEPLIRLTAITKWYPGGDHPAIADLSLEVERGRVVAILGPSGSGKTTLLRLIAGFERPDQGRIAIQGRYVAGEGRWVPPERRGAGMVFQEYALFPHLTVAENVAFGLGNHERRLRGLRVEQVLKLVGLSGLENRYPHQLSGGQQQRVALARALAPHPVVLLLDEPLSNLDPDMRFQMLPEVHAILRETETTAIIVTHDHEEAFALADRVAVLNQGRQQQEGTPEQVYHEPATPFVASFVGRAAFLPGRLVEDGVATELGLFSLPISSRQGQEVEVMLRPDDLSLEIDAAGEGMIVATQFRGLEHLYTVQLPSGWTVFSSQPSRRAYPLGSRVKLRAHPEHVVIFERGRDTSSVSAQR